MEGIQLFIVILILAVIPFNPTNILVDQLFLPFFTGVINSSGAYFWYAVGVVFIPKALFAFFELELAENFWDKYVKEKKKK